jgi:AcrR family transcriptional regulator
MERSGQADPGRPARRTRRRPEQVREQLLEATERVVIAKGQAATFQDIAAEAGIHRTVLQRHFPDMGELVREAALRPFREFIAVIQARAEGERADADESTWDLTRNLIAEMTAHFTKHRAFMARALADPAVLGEANWQVLHQTLDTLIDNLAPLTEEQMTMRGFATASMPMRSRLALAMIAGITLHGDWILPRGDLAPTADQLIDEMCEFALYGTRLVPETTRRQDRQPPRDAGRGVNRTSAAARRRSSGGR